MSEQRSEKGSDSGLTIIKKGIALTPSLKRGIGLTALIGLIHAGGQLSIPVIIQAVIDRGGLSSGEVKLDIVIKLIVAALAAVIFTEITRVIVARRLIMRSEQALRELRALAFDHVHKLSLAAQSEKSTGLLISRVTSDIDALSAFVDWGMYIWLVQPIILVGIVAVMAFYSWQLALMAVVIAIPMVAIFRWMQGGMAVSHDHLRTTIGTVLSNYSEALSGAEVVRTYGAHDRILQRLFASSRKRYEATFKTMAYQSAVFSVSDTFGALVSALVLVVGVTYRHELNLTSGELIAVLYLVGLLLAPLGHLGETLNQIQMAIAGWRKVIGLLEEPIEDLDPAQGKTLEPGAIAISAKNVEFAYKGGARVLHGINLEIPAGSRVAIVGETGSGKSTFARLLCRLADPTHGTIELNGVDLKDIATSHRHRGVRFVPQDGFLFNVSIGENISYGRDGTTEDEIDEAIETLGLKDWVRSLPKGLETRVGERGDSLSVGERQLASFARAAVADPGLLILDEATSSVDPHTDMLLTRALDRLAQGRTVISIAHRLSTAERSDLIVVLDQGNLAEFGSHDQLVGAGGIYARLFQAWQQQQLNDADGTDSADSEEN